MIHFGLDPIPSKAGGRDGGIVFGSEYDDGRIRAVCKYVFCSKDIRHLLVFCNQMGSGWHLKEHFGSEFWCGQMIHIYVQRMYAPGERMVCYSLDSGRDI